MRMILCLAFLLVSTLTIKAQDSIDDLEKKIKDLNFKIYHSSRQMMLQQFFTEERVRSEGNSGIKQIRSHQGGNKNYKSATHVATSVAAIHEHANNIRTVGMGEFIGVLNGVEFRTRHNDYRLYMPHRTSKKYHEREPVPFPPVPQEVLDKKTVDEQIKEMREWFKAWRDQDPSVRNYTKYFRPVLCYLEGAWTTTENKIDEPFHSDRHFLDANSWFDLQEKIKFTSYSGGKSRLENLAFLPTTVMSFINQSIPVFAQWNYRILCHPLSVDIPTSHFEIVDEFSTRMRHRRTIQQLLHSRAARFNLKRDIPGKDAVKGSRYNFLDILMSEIPGKDNYQGKLYDRGLDGTNVAMELDGVNKKDASRYHRIYKVGSPDAMGQSYMKRGFSDAYLFAAMTTQPKIPALEIENRKNCTNVQQRKICEKIKQKWSYAIPLEIIYLTPLSSWNPYNLKYKGDAKGEEGKTVTAGGRKGDCRNSARNYNGTNSKAYYITPSAFFGDKEANGDAADTAAKGTVCVLDEDGKSQHVRASGTRIFLPRIQGVGYLRTRYPIMPVHGEGSSVWKELNALKDYVLNPDQYTFIKAGGDIKQKNTFIKTAVSKSEHTTQHDHEIELTPDQRSQLEGGRKIMVTTSTANGHEHDMVISWNPGKKNYLYSQCDGRRTCWDNHDKWMQVDEGENSTMMSADDEYSLDYTEPEFFDEI